jgi:hypothetical protein
MGISLSKYGPSLLTALLAAMMSVPTGIAANQSEGQPSARPGDSAASLISPDGKWEAKATVTLNESVISIRNLKSGDTHEVLRRSSRLVFFWLGSGHDTRLAVNAFVHVDEATCLLANPENNKAWPLDVPSRKAFADIDATHKDFAHVSATIVAYSPPADQLVLCLSGRRGNSHDERYYMVALDGDVVKMLGGRSEIPSGWIVMQ